MRPQISFANVMSTIAVFLSLAGAGGGAYAALKVKANSVGTKQIKPDGAKGVDIEEASLGKVPSAAKADSATMADSAASAQNASKVGGLDPGQIGARAYGWVQGGTLDPNRSKNVLGVTRSGNKFCITLSPDVGSRLPALVVGAEGPNLADTVGGVATIAFYVWDSSGNDCPAGRLEVDAYEYVGDGTDNNNGTGNQTGDIVQTNTASFDYLSFSFVVP